MTRTRRTTPARLWSSRFLPGVRSEPRSPRPVSESDEDEFGSGFTDEDWEADEGSDEGWDENQDQGEEWEVDEASSGGTREANGR